MSDVWNKIKSYFIYIIAALAGIVAILLYFVNLKNKKIVELENKVAGIKTLQEAELLEKEIYLLKYKQELNNQELLDLDNLEKQLEAKKNNLIKEIHNQKPSEVEDYWKTH